MENTKQRSKKLLEYQGDGPVVSLYLKLGPAERSSGSYRITLKNLLKNQLEALEHRKFSPDDIKKTKKLLEDVKRFVENPQNIDGCGGIALFASDNMFEVFKLPYAHMDRLVVDTNPLSRGLLAMADEMGTVLFVAIDKRKARIYKVHATEIELLEEMDSRSPETLRGERPGRAPGAGIHAYGDKERVIRDETHRHYKRVADRIFEMFKHQRFDWLVLCGSPGDRSEFSNHLHAFLSQRLLGGVSGDINTINSHFIRSAISELMEVKKSQWEREIHKEFLSKMEAGLAISGPKAVLKALFNGQIRTLIVKRGFTIKGFRSEEGKLFMEEVPGSAPVPDLVDEIMEECLSQGTEVFVTDYEPLIQVAGNLGAILRFKLNNAP